MDKPINCGCGGKSMVRQSGDGFYIRCPECGTESADYQFLDEAIEAWNRAMSHQVTITWDGRIPPREIAKVNIHLHPCGVSGECLNCGGDVYNDDPYCSHCGAKLEWK